MFKLNLTNTSTKENINMTFPEDVSWEDMIVIFKTILIWQTFDKDQLKKAFNEETNTDGE